MSPDCMPRADGLGSINLGSSPLLFPRAAFDAVVIAASLGGREALEQLLGPLATDFPAPVLVAQHVDERSPGYLPRLLARSIRLAVKHAENGERLRAGTVYVAPPGQHLVFSPDGRCRLSDGPRVSFARPSADRLFEGAADAFGARTLGVILTGRLFDGVAGSVAIRRAGGVVVAQEPSSCRAPDMPRAAIRQGVVQLTLPIAVLASALHCLVALPGVPALFGFEQRAVA